MPHQPSTRTKRSRNADGKVAQPKSKFRVSRHASIIKAYERGKLKESVLRGRIRSGLSRMESALMRFLEGNPH
jgi:hypothetical protein